MHRQCTTCDGTGLLNPAEVLDRNDFDDVVTALIAAANDRAVQGPLVDPS